MATVFHKSVLLLVLTTVSATAASPTWKSFKNVRAVPDVPYSSFHRECDEGYENIGTEGRLNCARFTCDPLPASESHQWVEVEGAVDRARSFEAGSVYELQCAGGYRPIRDGLKRTKCLEGSRTWDKQEGDTIDTDDFGCIWGTAGGAKGCGWTPSINNARLESISKKPVRVYYECDEGFMAVGPTATYYGEDITPRRFYMECSDETQEFGPDSPQMPKPRCARVECPHLFRIDNGKAYLKANAENAETNYDFESQHTIQCNRGYHLLENPGVLAVVVECAADGTWKSLSDKVFSSDYTKCVGGTQ